jgi:transcriptional regulator with XRE-family HTH domain
MGVELGRAVQQRRHELGWSRRDLAERSEVSYPYVSQIETGERDPSLRTMQRLAETLEVPVERLASLVSVEDWATTGSAPVRSSPARLSEAPRSDTSSDKVLASVRRRLQAVPPLVRLELLAELTAEAAREAAATRR